MAENFVIPPLQTARLSLEAVTDSDVDGIYHLYADPVITEYLGVERMESPQDACHWLTQHIQRQAKGQGILMVIRLNNHPQVIGTCSLEDINWFHHNATLGYSLARLFWGKGLMYEALSALIQYLFVDRADSASLQRLQAWTQPQNVASIRLLQNLGFTLEGCLRQLFFWHGDYWDLNCFSLLRHEYPSG